jgi:hypothetical protein
MEGAAVGLAADQRIHHGRGKFLDQLANPGRTGTLAAVNGQERLGYGNRDLAGLETDDCAVAAVRLVASCIFSPSNILVAWKLQPEGHLSETTALSEYHYMLCLGHTDMTNSSSTTPPVKKFLHLKNKMLGCAIEVHAK